MDVRIEQIAQVCHETNKSYCETIGDDSQPTWHDAPSWQRESAIQGVRKHLAGQLTPEQSHKSWLEEKELTGWIYGKKKDPIKKEHPCMVPYSELPEEQQMKDKLFKTIADCFK